MLGSFVRVLFRVSFIFESFQTDLIFSNQVLGCPTRDQSACFFIICPWQATEGRELADTRIAEALRTLEK